MSTEKVRPVHRSGGWSGFHRLYRQAAHAAFGELKASHHRLAETWRRLERPGGESVLPEYMHQLEAFVVLSATAEIYCAMAIEALLNFYGVNRLGEEFYVRNLERISIVAKLELLLATCDGILLSKDEELSALLRGLSQRRNQLVHPRSREFKLDRVSPGNWPEELPKIVGQTVGDMERFLALFAAINENTKAAVQFFNTDV